MITEQQNLQVNPTTLCGFFYWTDLKMINECRVLHWKEIYCKYKKEKGTGGRDWHLKSSCKLFDCKISLVSVVVADHQIHPRQPLCTLQTVRSQFSSKVMQKKAENFFWTRKSTELRLFPSICLSFIWKKNFLLTLTNTKVKVLFFGTYFWP